MFAVLARKDLVSAADAIAPAALAGLASGDAVAWPLLAPVLTPFIASALLAYIGDPLVDKREARKLWCVVSVVIVFTLMFCVVVIVPLL